MTPNLTHDWRHRVGQRHMRSIDQLGRLLKAPNEARRCGDSRGGSRSGARDGGSGANSCMADGATRVAGLGRIDSDRARFHNADHIGAGRARRRGSAT